MANVTGPIMPLPTSPRRPALRDAFEQVPSGSAGPSLSQVLNQSMQGTMDSFQPFLSGTPTGKTFNRLSKKKLAHEAASQPWDPSGSVFAGIEDYAGVMPRKG